MIKKEKKKLEEYKKIKKMIDEVASGVTEFIKKDTASTSAKKLVF